MLLVSLGTNRLQCLYLAEVTVIYTTGREKVVREQAHSVRSFRTSHLADEVTESYHHGQNRREQFNVFPKGEL